MITQTITLPFYVIALMMIAGAAIGYAIRAGQRMKMRKLIDELESEKHLGNTRVLELEKETLELENRLREWQSPVIPIKKTNLPVAEDNQAKVASRDMSFRKQLLGKDDKNRHSASR